MRPWDNTSRSWDTPAKLPEPFPFLTQRHMDRRVSWPKENKATDWEKVVFSVNEFWENISIEFLKKYCKFMETRVVFERKVNVRRLSTSGCYAVVKFVLHAVYF